MIVRKGQAPSKRREADGFGILETSGLSVAGGIAPFGAYLQTLHPGARSSMRHWHAHEDEFLFVVSGRVTVLENDGAHVLEPGDAACWPAGVANAHSVVNESDQPCSYLIVGTRPTHDICHYPDAGKTLHTEGETWRFVDAQGQVLKGGRVEPDW